MIIAKFWLFGELKTELQPQSPGGGSGRTPAAAAGPRARAGKFVFFGIRKVAKNNDFTWVLDET